jgi:hypothetical protein
VAWHKEELIGDKPLVVEYIYQLVTFGGYSGKIPARREVGNYYNAKWLRTLIVISIKCRHGLK